MFIDGYMVLNDNFEFEPLKIEYESKIISLEKSEVKNKGYIIPGLVDIHTHGAIGQELASPTDFDEYLYFMYSKGITTFYPTTVSMPIDELCENISFYKDVPEISGINVEGPFLNVEMRGAHFEGHICEAYIQALYKLQEACGGKVKLITVAPEIGENMEFISKASSMGVHVSIGHSACDYQTAVSAFSFGADHVTHLYNAMKPLHHRNSGLVGAAFDKDVYVEIIGDGIHVAPEVVRLTYRAIGDDRLVLISDSMSATGLKDGKYTLGDMEVRVTDETAYTLDGALAGSTRTLYDMVRSVNRMGVPIEKAVKMATKTACKSVKEDDIGVIACGKRADFVILDENFEVVQTIRDGKTVFSVC